MSFTNSEIVVSGWDSQIKFYSYNEGSYSLSNTFVIPSSLIMASIVSKDSQTLVCGSMMRDLFFCNKINNTYEVEFTSFTFSTSNSFIMDDDQLYYTVISADMNIYTFYSCPNGCANCYFPNNCSQC